MGVGISAGFLLIFNAAILFFIILALIVCGMIYSKSPVGERKFLLIVFLIALISRIIFSYIYYQASFSSGYGVDFMGDAVNYSNNALYVTEVMTKKDFSRYTSEDAYLQENMRLARQAFDYKLPPVYNFQISPYAYYIAFLYLIFGYAPFLVKLLNCLFGSLLALAVYSLAKEIFNLKAARIAMVIAAFFPSLFFWSITSLRDTPIILCLTFLFWLLIKLQAKFDWVYLAIFIGLFPVLANIRRDIIIIFLFVIFLIFFIYKFKPINKFIIVSSVILIFLQLIFYPDSGVAKIANQYLLSRVKPLILFRTHRDYVHYANTGYIIYPLRLYDQCYDNPSCKKDSPEYKDIKDMEPGEFFMAIWLGLIYFIFSPFSWSATSLWELITYPQMVIWYFLLFMAAIGTFMALRYNANKITGIIIFCSFVVFLSALTEGNTGTLFRHRDMLTPLLLVFSAGGIARILLVRVKGKNESIT